MAVPLSEDLRRRLAGAVDGGSSARSAARRFAVSASAAVKLMQPVRVTGSIAPAKIGGYRKAILEPHGDLLCVQDNIAAPTFASPLTRSRRWMQPARLRSR